MISVKVQRRMCLVLAIAWFVWAYTDGRIPLYVTIPLSVWLLMILLDLRSQFFGEAP